MPPQRQHSLERLVDDLADYIETTAVFLANALEEEGHIPFEARISDQQRYDYFNAMLWQPDGKPNVSGRNRLVEQSGMDEYIRIYDWVQRRRQRGTPLRGTTRPSPDTDPTPYEPLSE